MIFLSIKIPPTNTGSEQGMEAMLHSIHRLLPQGAPLSLELTSSHQFLTFYIGTLAQYKSIIESQLYAQFPEAEIMQTSDYLPKSFSHTAIAQIDFRRSSFNPFTTYSQLEENFLKTLSALISKTETYDELYIQLALRRVGAKSFDRGFHGLRYNLFGKKYDGETVSPAYEKFAQDLFAGKLRIAYSSGDKQQAEQKLRIVINLLKAVKGPHNELKRRKIFVPKNITEQFLSRSTKGGDFWTASELATLYHFPFQGSFVSNVVQTSSKRAPAPDILPVDGQTNQQDVSFIGKTTYRNEQKTFGIKRIDRRRHLYVVGKTGSGKSKLLELLLIADMQQGKGCCLLDPHGDLAEELLKYVPQNRIQDVVYVDPADKNFPIAFNPLEPVDDYEERQHLATFFIATFKKFFEAEWTPRMEHLIRYIVLALLETPDSNILGIPRLLSDTAYRQRVVKQIQDPVVKAFWTTDYSPSNTEWNAASVPVLNKLGQFIANPIIRNMIGQKKNVLDFSSFMNEGKIVLLNISKGKLGDENTSLLGSMFITKIQQGALARARMREEERRDFYFYVDEFQNFATDAFSSILSEARKYHLNVTIAHQYIAQLPEDVRNTAFGNVGSIISFAVGAEDAEYLSHEFAPVFTADDIISLHTREMYSKLSIDGRLTRPFSAVTINVPNATNQNTQPIIDASRMTYASNKTAVENDIARWSESTQVITEDEETFPEPII